jgi:hypothetical protein
MRASVSRPDPDDEFATLRVLLMRVDYLRRLWRDAAKAARDTGSVADAVAPGGALFIPLWAATTLCLASLYVVVEGWERLGLKDAVIDGLLAETGRVAALRDLRNSVFHFGAIHNPAFMGVLADDATTEWAGSLHGAFRRFIDARLISGGAA